jgi:hypothetical protein
MELVGSLPYTQNRVTFSYPEPDQSKSSQLMFLGYILILSCHLRINILKGLFRSVFRTKILMLLRVL